MRFALFIYRVREQERLTQAVTEKKDITAILYINLPGKLARVGVVKAL